MRGIVRESLYEFQKGQDPKDVMGVGDKTLRDLMKLSNEELIVKAAKGYKKEEGDIIRALMEKNPGTNKTHWQNETSRGRTIYNSKDTRGRYSDSDTNYNTPIRSLIAKDDLEELKKWRDMGLIDNDQLEVETQFGGSGSRRRHWAVPRYISPKMLKWIIKEYKKDNNYKGGKYPISSWSVGTLIKTAKPEDREELIELILKKTRSKEDSGGRNRVAEILEQLAYADEKELFFKYLPQYTGEFKLDGDVDEEGDEVTLPKWYKKWELENYVSNAWKKLIGSKFMKRQVKDLEEEIRWRQEMLDTIRKKNPSLEDKKEVVDNYYRDYKWRGSDDD
jgi:hypothetical protein